MDGQLDGHTFDVLVVGAGAAGLYSALCLPQHLQVGLISKDKLSRSASDWAQGGIAAVVSPEDSTELHIVDTLKAGAGLCDYDAVKFLVEQASDCIHNLVDLGVAFDRQGDTLALTLEAAHSRRRVLHAADTTGRAVVSTLANHVLARENIQVLSPALVLDLWMDAGQCRGVCLVYQGQIHWLAAKAVVLATGGGGQVFAQTTNPKVSTGDGVAIAHRAGAILRDLEFFQFHPTALTQPGAPRFLISEAVRGEGAHLIDKTGRRFAFDYHPAGELAPRDVVSRAIFSHLQKTEADPASAHVWLDLRPIPPDRIHHRFPNIIQVCQQWGIDILKEPIPVAPAAHYWMGGILADTMNRTSIPGLYAVGETASTGVHGANRLASNSLLECIVFGAQLAHIAIEPTIEPSLNARDVPPSDSLPEAARAPIVLPSIDPAELAWIQNIRVELPRLVWQSAGICREHSHLQAALTQIQQWQREFAALAVSRSLQALLPTQSVSLAAQADGEGVLRQWGELQNLLTIAALILHSAHLRTESRGGHYCSDFPDTSEDWTVHTLVRCDRWWQGSVHSAPS
ncbi:L-aspartate oxidase [Alkalinema sp. FACHB-956]|nr:L-aspartate oxidase [Alkalinema sp. FACHB-956]MBD2327376.1 L-aspartate oxidase [Alkalinema sp. FACHB-956]